MMLEYIFIGVIVIVIVYGYLKHKSHDEEIEQDDEY